MGEGGAENKNCRGESAENKSLAYLRAVYLRVHLLGAAANIGRAELVEPRRGGFGRARRRAKGKGLVSLGA